MKRKHYLIGIVFTLMSFYIVNVSYAFWTDELIVQGKATLTYEVNIVDDSKPIVKDKSKKKSTKNKKSSAPKADIIMDENKDEIEQTESDDKPEDTDLEELDNAEDTDRKDMEIDYSEAIAVIPEDIEVDSQSQQDGSVNAEIVKDIGEEPTSASTYDESIIFDDDNGDDLGS